MSTGNEVSKVGSQLNENQIPSGNNLMIAAMIKEFGGLQVYQFDDNSVDIYKTFKVPEQ